MQEWQRCMSKENQPFRHEGVYEGHLIEKTKIGDYDALVPTITGQSWIYGYGNLVLDPTDPFEEGFTIGDIWA